MVEITIYARPIFDFFTNNFIFLQENTACVFLDAVLSKKNITKCLI